MRWLTGDSLRSAARGVRAASFTVVMATGITSAATLLAGLAGLADALLAIAVASFVLLTVLLIAGCWRNPALAVDRSSPAGAFAAFAFTAACAVLGRDLVAAGLTGAALVPAVLVLAVLTGASWLALTVIVPVRMAVSPGARPAIADVAGSWYLWAVATQSLAITAVSLHAASILAAQPAAAVALGAWLAGIVIYLATTSLEVVRLRRLGPGPAGSRASYWVAMGAASISVLAGAEVLGIGTGATVVSAGAGARAAISDTATALWAVASCLLLVLAWRTAAVLLRAPFRPRYRPGGWLVIFPLGMYATASMQLGRAAGVPWMHGIGTALAWVAVTVWAAVFATMAAAAASRAAKDSRARVPAGQRGPGTGEHDGAAHERSLRKYQALLTLLLPADGSTPATLPWSAWRVVIRARDHQTRASHLLTALVSGPDDAVLSASASVVVTMVVFGPSPDDCLGVGDNFTLWRGGDVARGIITRRLFV